MTLLADVVTASQEVTDTSSRSRKVAVLAELLRRLEPGEVTAVVGFLAGAPRQGRVGVGYSTIYGLESAPAEEASLTVGELDRAIDEIRETTGSGSAGGAGGSSRSSSAAPPRRRPTSSGGSSRASSGRARSPG